MVEQLRAGVSARKARVCIFDFDGTISLIRSGWSDVMVPMMVEILLDLNTGESEEELGRVVEDFVWRLTGKQTIYQMIELASQIRQRGGRPLEPLAYKKMYLDRLHDRIRYRLEELRQGKVPPEKYLVPGARELVLALRERGLAMYLASGTDQEYMREEARLLDIAPCFDGGVRGDEFLGFGDGYVEIENVKEVGGVAVGVATAEPECQVVDEWKRRRLAGVGADFIVPNFLCREELMQTLFANG